MAVQLKSGTVQYLVNLRWTEVPFLAHEEVNYEAGTGGRQQQQKWRPGESQKSAPLASYVSLSMSVWERLPMSHL